METFVLIIVICMLAFCITIKEKDGSFENGIYKVLQKMIQEEKRKNI